MDGITYIFCLTWLFQTDVATHTASQERSLLIYISMYDRFYICWLLLSKDLWN